MDGRQCDVCATPETLAARVAHSRQRAHLKTLTVRTYLWLLFLGFTGYTRYLVGSSIYNFGRQWALLRASNTPREVAWAGALTVMAETPQTQRYELILVFLPAGAWAMQGCDGHAMNYMLWYLPVCSFAM